MYRLADSRNGETFYVGKGNARGEVVGHMRLFDGVQPGEVLVESIRPGDFR